jgi:imidazolonepropionase
MNGCLVVRGARQLVTLRGPEAPRRGEILRELAIIPDGAMLVKDGRVEAVGPSRRIENLALARRAEELDAAGRVVLPGFVDSHTHLVHGPPRLEDYEMAIAGKSYAEIAAAGGGILSSVRAVRARSASSLTHQAMKAIRWMISHGTTTVEAKSGYGLDESTELKLLRVANNLDGKPISVVPTFLGAHAVPPEFNGNGHRYVEWLGSHLMPKVAGRNLARFADIYCDAGAFALDQTLHYLLAARECGFQLKVHASQFRNLGAVQLAVEMNATSVDHLECIGEAEIDSLVLSRTIATLLPGSVLHLGLDRYAPARKLIDGGAAVALATDFNPGSSPTPSMQMVLSLACSRMRMTPAEAVSAATINGAWALGMQNEVGSLEPGKSADFTVFDVPDYREIPYHFGANLAVTVVKAGRVIYQRGEAQCHADS